MSPESAIMSVAPFPGSFLLTVELTAVQHAISCGRLLGYAPGCVSMEAYYRPVFIAMPYAEDFESSHAWFIANRDALKREALKRLIGPVTLN